MTTRLGLGWTAAVLALAAAAAACSRTPPAQTTPPVAVVAEAPPDDDQEWEAAWDAVTGEGQVASAPTDAGDWRLARAADGTIVAERGSASELGAADDVAIQRDVRARLVASGEVEAQDVDVQSQDGHVTLSGRVSTRHQALDALRAATSVEGVRRVTSTLTWAALP